MIQKVTLPALGETVDTSTIERWVKKEGDPVRRGDVLCEITTDKATLEVESFYEGTLLKILAPEGSELPVGALIAVVGEPGEPIPPEVLAEAEAALAKAPAGTGAASGGPSPAAKAPTGPSASPTASQAAAPAGAPSAAASGSTPGGTAAAASAEAPAAPAAGEGVHQVTMPALGETVDTSTIERWVKKEGDPVRRGDVLCEITTDKATLEVESFYEGTLLKILAPEGSELPVGAPIALVGPAGAKVEAPPASPAAPSAGAGAGTAAPSPAGTAAPQSPAQVAPPAAPAEAPAAAERRGRVFASPRARRRARELGVVLEALEGTGPGGRIVEADVVEAAAAGRGVKATPLARKAAVRLGVDLRGVRGTGPGGKVRKADVEAAASAVPTAPAAPVAPPVRPGEVVPLTKMRRIVAERMTHSKQTIPCYYLSMDIDMTEVACLRAKLNQRTGGDPKVSFNDFVIKACGLALLQFPAVNSRWVEGGIERRGVAHVGLAVALDEGLLVPVVRDADAKSVVQIARETADLAARARSKRLTPDEYQDGCMTVSNLGMFGVTSFIPVVNPGESCILGLGVIQDRVVIHQGGMYIRKMMTATLSVDHRLVDGAVGAQFLETIRDLLERPQQLVEGTG